MAELIITIDGPAGSGKSTVARLLADRLDATFLDTGAMYRAITLAAVRDGVALSDERQLVQILERHRFDFEAARGRMLVSIDGQDVTEAIRDSELTARVRYAATAPRVRERLVALQRAFAAQHTRIVTEGRDQGTVVFPDANVKFYLTADATERARRRKAELDAKERAADLEQIRQAIEARDRSDENRAVGPLKPAPDAITVDTTRLTIEEVVERVYRHVLERAKDEAQRTEDGGGASVAVTPLCSEGVPPLRPAGILPAEKEERGQDALATGSKGKMPSPRSLRRAAMDATDTSSATATDLRSSAADPHDDSHWHRLKVAWYWVAWFMCKVFCRHPLSPAVPGPGEHPAQWGIHSGRQPPKLPGPGLLRRGNSPSSDIRGAGHSLQIPTFWMADPFRECDSHRAGQTRYLGHQGVHRPAPPGRSRLLVSRSDADLRRPDHSIQGRLRAPMPAPSRRRWSRSWWTAPSSAGPGRRSCSSPGVSPSGMVRPWTPSRFAR